MAFPGAALRAQAQQPDAPLSRAAVGTAGTAGLTILHSFTGTLDGSSPKAGLVTGPNSALYGTSYTGGLTGGGTVFQLSASGGVWTHQVLFSFAGGADGGNPVASMLAIGNQLYGTTLNGGASGLGTVFQLTAPSVQGGVWTQRVLYSFAGGSDGASPQAPLVKSSKQLLYGTTYNGGSAGMGTVYLLAPTSGSGWNEEVLYTFAGGLADGAHPLAGLLIGAGGVLYGTTTGGGANGSGTVFQLTPPATTGGAWTETVLYSFAGAVDGGIPESNLVMDATGALYGTTFWGGSGTRCSQGLLKGCGTIYQLTPPGAPGGAWTHNLIYNFTAQNSDGSHPYQNIVMGSTGILFGSTYAGGSLSTTCFGTLYTGCGTIYVLKPPATAGGTWTHSTLHAFQESEGGGLNGVILSGAAIYGTTSLGGPSGGFGTAFQFVH